MSSSRWINRSHITTGRTKGPQPDIGWGNALVTRRYLTVPLVSANRGIGFQLNQFGRQGRNAGRRKFHSGNKVRRINWLARIVSGVLTSFSFFFRHRAYFSMRNPEMPSELNLSGRMIFTHTSLSGSRILQPRILTPSVLRNYAILKAKRQNGSETC